MKSTRSIFAQLRAKARVGILVEAIGCLVLAATAYVFVSYGLDRSLRLEVGFRMFLALLLATALTRLWLRRAHRPLRIELDDEEMALAVERQDPGIRQSLISAVQFDEELAAGRQRGAESVELKRRVVDDVESRLTNIPVHRALDGKRVLRFLAAGVAGIAIVGTWAAAYPAEAGLWAKRNLAFSNEPWPRDTYLAFLDFTTNTYRLAEREDLTIRVKVDGVVPDKVELDCRFANGEQTIRPMTQSGEDVFSVTLESLLENAEVYAFGGDGETSVLKIELIPRPRITNLALTLHYPEYMERDSEPVVDTGGDVRVPRGGRLAVLATSSKPLRSASMTFAQDEQVPVELYDGGLGIRGEYAPTDSGVLKIEALDHDDLGPSQPPQIYLRLVEDTAPGLDFTTDGIGSSITANARIPGYLKIDDDYGIRTLESSYRITEATVAENGDTEDKPPEPEFVTAPFIGLDGLQPGATEADLEVSLDLAPLKASTPNPTDENLLRPGQILSIRFTATDNFAPEPHTGESEILNLRVVTRDKLLEELRRRQAEQRRELERVLEKELAARDDLGEIVSPTSGDARAAQARIRIQGLARQQNSLGMRVQGIATRYRQILREMTNNRLFEPQITSRLDAQICSPLLTLALDDFPKTAEQTATFAEAGDQSVRDSAVEGYNAIIAVIRSVLLKMERTEDIAAIVEALKVVIDVEGKVEDLVEKALEGEAAGILDPGKDKDDRDGGGRKNK